MSLLYIKHLRTTRCRLKFLSEGLECYKDTQMKKYDITKLTAVLKATMYSTKKDITLLCYLFSWAHAHCKTNLQIRKLLGVGKLLFASLTKSIC